MNNVWTTTLVPFYQDHRTPIPWNFCCFQALLCSGSQHQPAQCKSTITDKNNPIKCRIKDAIAIINKEKPLWIGTRDWTSQPLTILSCGFITTFLWCHLRLHIAKSKFKQFRQNICFLSQILLWSLNIIHRKFSIYYFFQALLRGRGELDRKKGDFLIQWNASTEVRFLWDGLVVPRRYTAFSNNKKMVTILHRELESKVEKVNKPMKLEVMGLKPKTIWISSRNKPIVSEK